MRIKQAPQLKVHPRVNASMLALLLGALAVAGCGSSSNTTSSSSAAPAAPAAPATASSATSTTPAPAKAKPAKTTPPATAPAAAAPQTLTLEANAEGQLKFNTTALTAKAGNVSLAFKNAAALGHNVTVVSASGTVIGATPTFSEGSKTVSLTLKPGAYKFYCSVPGHRPGGMEGTLTVQ